jgi:hypothetical protein
MGGIGSRPATCANCGKRLTRKSWYYRNGKHFCKKRCWDKEVEKVSAEKAEKAEKASKEKEQADAAAKAKAEEAKGGEPAAPEQKAAAASA